MKVVTAAEMREIDRISIEDYGIPSEVLMNSAGRFVADFINEKYPGKKVNIFCGTGNNGGDGFTAAYYLHNSGLDVRIFLAGKKEKVSDTSRVFMELCEKCNLAVFEKQDGSDIYIDSGIVLDAVFGTGFNGEPAGVHKEFIDIINNAGLPVVAVDIPSGLSSDGEPPRGVAVMADYTVTIGLHKISTATYPGKNFCGEVITADIGFPRVLTDSDNITTSILDKTELKKMSLFKTGADIHKGDRGHTLIIGGFQGMEGALMLSASALFRTGAGLVTAATCSESRSIIAGKIPEMMTIALPGSGLEMYFEEIIKNRRFTSLIIGPGLGRSKEASETFSAAINSAAKSGIRKILIDGDGLFLLAAYLKDKTLPKGAEYCITPHLMEASRIAGAALDSIKNKRLQWCIDIAKQAGCITVLKGPATIISDGDKSYINTTGNSYLATAGSGDVLSGIIGSFLNSADSALYAACAGVYVHGLCADIYASENVSSSMKSGDIIDNISNALNGLYAR